MWRVPKPGVSALDSYQTSISRVADPALKARFESVENVIVQSSAAFAAAAAAATLETLPHPTGVGGQVTTKEMVNLYDQRFARRKSAGRPIYDAIKLAPAHGRCPLCGLGTVSTLDHHLPKTVYPALAVTPANLVPACIDCNKNKTSATPTCAAEQTIHPYFDDIEDDHWLTATVVEEQPAALLFDVAPPTHWPDVLAARVRKHFSTFRLQYLYGVNAAREMSQQRGLLKKLHAGAGAADVRAYLQDQAESCAQIGTNLWRTAAFRSLGQSDWYCEGGFDFA
jgi:hypothetical protein